MLITFLVACGGASEQDDNSSDNQVEKSGQTDEEASNEEETSVKDMQAKMGELDYKEFQLEAEYGNHQAYEAEIE